MTSRADRLRDGVARLAARILGRRAEQSAEEEATSDGGAEAPVTGAAEPSPSPGTEPPPGRPAGAGRPVPSVALPWGLRVAAEAAWRLLLLAALIWVLGRIIGAISLLVLAFAAGLLVTALLQPTVAWLKRHRVSRGLATAITFVAGFVAIGLIGWFVAWQVTDNLPTLTNRVQEAIDEMQRWAIDGPFHVPEEQVDNIGKSLSKWLGDHSETATSAGLAGITVLVGFLSGVALTMFISLFLLYDGARIWNWVLKLVPSAAREGVAGAGPLAWATLTGYVRGTVLIALIDAVFIGLGLLILGVPLAVPLAVVIFIAAFVPIVGAAISGALAVLVALVTNGLLTAVLAAAVVALVNELEGHVLQPFILGRMVRVHPLAVVLAVVAGSLIAGIPGAVVAVPLMAVINTAAGYLKAYSEDRRAPALPTTAGPTTSKRPVP
ncbi:AI-2E family transporter [Streptomyces albidus (ex Kaewkla and Franco 2022)]|uniref:AI-2E family transporter n=1 Tax=Streptomyces albidus (ex Kaewkla and Franco 2022) TaxID=722709 RepID=UPI0015EED1C9|nr:AI-2E family transporter [Streptomyces albidus (ex Kaewkla and Franco 2022)]